MQSDTRHSEVRGSAYVGLFAAVGLRLTMRMCETDVWLWLVVSQVKSMRDCEYYLQNFSADADTVWVWYVVASEAIIREVRDTQQWRTRPTAIWNTASRGSHVSRCVFMCLCVRSPVLPSHHNHHHDLATKQATATW